MADPRRWPPRPLRWPEEPLTDGIVTLDRMTADDIDAIVEGAGDAETARWIPVPVPYTRSDAEEFLDAQRTEAESGQLLNFAVRLAGGTRLIGSIGAGFRGAPGECEIGYWLHPTARGKGLTAKAIRVLAGHVFATYPVHRAELLVDPENVASQKVCKAAGCTFEGLRRAATTTVRGEGHTSMLVYSLIPADLA